jgi:hypothetical protein
VTPQLGASLTIGFSEGKQTKQQKFSGSHPRPGKVIFLVGQNYKKISLINEAWVK